MNIIDALMIAQHTVGLDVQINLEASDVNRDQRITIVDALIVAQFYVGILNSLPL